MEALPFELVECVIGFLDVWNTEAFRRVRKWGLEVERQIVRRQASLAILTDRVDYTSIRQFSAALRDDECLMTCLLISAPYPSIHIEAVSERLRGHRGLMMRLINIDAMVLQHVSEEMRSDPSIVWGALQSVWRHPSPHGAIGVSMAWLHSTLCDMDDLARAILCQKPNVAFLEMEHISPRLRANADFIRFATQLNPRCLRYASDELRGDRDVVLCAIASASVHHHRMGDCVHVEWISATLRDDVDVILSLVEMSGETASCHFEKASSRLRGDIDTVYHAILCDPRCLHFASLNLRRNKMLALCAAKVYVRNGGRLNPQRLAPELRGDADIHQAITYASAALCGVE